MSPHCPVLVPGVRTARGPTVAGVGTSSVSAPYHRQSASTGPRGELSCWAANWTPQYSGYLILGLQVGTVWWDQIGVSFAGLLGVRKCDARPIWWKHFVSNQNVMEATLRWCYHQSWAVNIKFPNKSFILAASNSRAGNKSSRSFTVDSLKLPTVLEQFNYVSTKC